MNSDLDQLTYLIRRVRFEPIGDIRRLCEIAGISILDVLTCSEPSEVDLWSSDDESDVNTSNPTSIEQEVLGSEEEFLALVKSKAREPTELVWLSSIARKRGFISISHYAAALAVKPVSRDRTRDDAGAIASLFVAVKEGEIDLETLTEFLDQSLELDGISIQELYDMYLTSENHS